MSSSLSYEEGLYQGGSSCYSSIDIGNLMTCYDDAVRIAKEIENTKAKVVFGGILEEQLKSVKDSIDSIEESLSTASTNVNNAKNLVARYNEGVTGFGEMFVVNYLTANSVGMGNGEAPPSAGTSVKENAINWARSIAEDNEHGYSQADTVRWGNPDYDCSSLVISAYENAGVPVKAAGAGYTGNMKKAFLSTGKFEWIPGNPKVEDLKAGDILLSEGSHTELYVGDGKNVGAHKNYDGKAGDSSDREIDIKDYYSYPWDGVLRYKGD